jgi:hypothetical protein
LGKFSRVLTRMGVRLHFSHNQQFRTKKGFHYCRTGKCARHKLSVPGYRSQVSQFAWWYVRLVWREHLQNKTHAKRSAAQSETWLRMTRYDPKLVRVTHNEQCERCLGNPSLNTNLSIARPVGYLTERYGYPPITTQVTQVHQQFLLEKRSAYPGAEYLTTGSNGKHVESVSVPYAFRQRGREYLGTPYLVSCLNSKCPSRGVPDCLNTTTT